ncbi:hypothetical protein BGX24_007030 [Mortierella sp. AD032]|nr:hypothetical protein BGX24_007030 [Mortierella sp. AD032]
MNSRPESIPADRQDMGPAHSGPICIEDQHPASAVLFVETGSSSTSDKHPYSALDSGARLCQPTLGPHLTMSCEGTERAVDTHSSDPLLAISDLVPDSEEPRPLSSAPHPAAEPPRLFFRLDPAGLDTCSLAHQRQRLMKDGVSTATIKVMTESTLAKTRKRHYKGP